MQISVTGAKSVIEVVVERGIEEAVDRERQRPDQDRVAIGVGARDRLGADIAAGAALVLDHHLLAPERGEPVGEDAGDRVGSASRRERNDQANDAARPALCARGAHRQGRSERRRGGKPDQPAAGDHGCPPRTVAPTVRAIAAITIHQRLRRYSSTHSAEAWHRYRAG